MALAWRATSTSELEPSAAPDAAGSSPDAAVVGTWTSEPPCTATPAEIYEVAPSPGARGSVVACALGERLDQPATQDALTATNVDVIAETGVRVVKLAYRTVRSDGTPAITTAMEANVAGSHGFTW